MWAGVNVMRVCSATRLPSSGVTCLLFAIDCYATSHYYTCAIYDGLSPFLQVTIFASTPEINIVVF